jgi:ribosomal protein L7/L12
MSNEIELIDLRTRVSRLEAQLEALYQHLGLNFQDSQSLADEESPVIEALRTGNLLEAIKVYRQIHNVSLGEAKAAVENTQARLGR